MRVGKFFTWIFYGFLLLFICLILSSRSSQFLKKVPFNQKHNISFSEKESSLTKGDIIEQIFQSSKPTLMRTYNNKIKDNSNSKNVPLREKQKGSENLKKNLPNSQTSPKTKEKIIKKEIIFNNIIQNNPTFPSNGYQEQIAVDLFYFSSNYSHICDKCPITTIYQNSSSCSFFSDWKNSITFQDPLGSPDYILTNATMTFVGTFHCIAEASVAQLYVYFAGSLVGPKAGPSIPVGCTCPNCGGTLEMNFNYFPSYKYGQENVIQFVPIGDLCISSMQLILFYEDIDLQIISVTPKCIPLQGGNTLFVNASSSHFPSSDPSLSCVFGEKVNTQATCNSYDEIVCTSPNVISFKNGSVDTPIVIDLQISLSDSYMSNSLKVYFYTIPREIFVSQTTIYKNSGQQTIIVKTGDTHSFVDECSSTLLCRFSDIATYGTFLDEQTISCSISAQQVSSFLTPSLNFSFTQDLQNWSDNFTVYIEEAFSPDESDNDSGTSLPLNWVIVGVVCVVVVLGVIIIWVKKRKLSQSGQDLFGPMDKKLLLNNIVLKESIGKGSFGQVYRAIWEGTVVAVKKIHPHMVSDKRSLKDFQNEVMIMRCLHHQNIVQFLGAGIDPPEIFLVTEYMEHGSLYHVLHSSMEITLSRLYRIATDAVKGMSYLHSSQPVTIHRDLKSHNLLIDQYWRTKVTDFGLSKTIDNVWDSLQTACGTPCWTAPEILRGETYSTKADVYSFGIVLWEMITREDPFKNMTPFRIVLAVGSNGVRPPIPTECDPGWKLLIQDCWDSHPNKRPEFPEVLRRLVAMQETDPRLEGEIQEEEILSEATETSKLINERASSPRGRSFT